MHRKSEVFAQFHALHKPPEFMCNIPNWRGAERGYSIELHICKPTQKESINSYLTTNFKFA
jgi:hypothetical protein